MSLTQRIVFGAGLSARVAARERRYELGDILPEPCPTCGARVILRASRYGGFWACEERSCDTLVGAHKGSRAPLGTPADKETRQARIEAHAAFDLLWRDRWMSRREAYAWLRGAMALSHEDAHIGRMSFEQCAEVVDAANRKLKRLHASEAEA